MRVLLLANGDIHDYEAIRAWSVGFDRTIACDGGLVHAKALGIVPDVLLGDMDSAPTALLAEYRSLGVPVQTFPAEKDDTDLALGIAYALSLQHITGLTVLGAMGGRFDHALANVHALTAALIQRVPAEIISENARICLLGDPLHCGVQPIHAERLSTGGYIYDTNSCTYVFKKGCYQTVSLLPLTTEVTGVVTRGLQYPLRGETLRFGSTRGVSNAFAPSDSPDSASPASPSSAAPEPEATAAVTISDGVLIIICYR